MKGKGIATPSLGLAWVCFLILLWGGCDTSLAISPDISYWTRDVSEALPEELTGRDDYDLEITASGSTVHLLWMADGENGKELFYRRSTDAGKTWEPRKLIFTDDSIDHDPEFKRLSVDGNTVHIAVDFYDTGDTWFGRVAYIRSTDNGATFESPRILFDSAYAWHIYHLRISSDTGAVSIGFVHECNWNKRREGLSLNSADGGTTFTVGTFYSGDSLSTVDLEDFKRSGDHVYALYRLTGQILTLGASSDGGAVFNSVVLSDPSTITELSHLHWDNYLPKIAVSGSNVYVAWSGWDLQDELCVFFRRSSDYGSTFLDAVNLSKGKIGSAEIVDKGYETIASMGQYVYIVFGSTDGEIFLSSSSNAGVEFTAPQLLTEPNVPFLEEGWQPQVELDPGDSTGATVHVLFETPKYVRSTDGGLTFTRPVILWPEDCADLAYGAHPHMTVTVDGTVHYAVALNAYSDSLCDGGCDDDIFYGSWHLPPEPSPGNMGIQLISSGKDSEGGRYDNMQIPSSRDLNFSSQMTAEVRVKPLEGGRTTGTSSMRMPIFHKLGDGWSSVIYLLGTVNGPNGAGREAMAAIETSSGSYELIPENEPAAVVSDNAWTHLAMTYDAAGGPDNFKLYVNGQLVSSDTVTGDIDSRDGIVRAGYYGSWVIDELRFWDRALSQEEILVSMFDALQGDEEHLVACYGFNGTIRDITGRGNDGVLQYKEEFLPVSPIPQAAFTAGPAQGVVPLVVQFTDQSTGTFDSWTWKFGDNQTGSGQNPKHTYTKAGTYTVSLTINGSEGQDTLTKEGCIIVSEPPPSAAFTCSPTEGSLPLTVKFKDLSSGKIEKWRWDFGDGQTSVSRNPSHTYRKAGTYTVTLKTMGPGGSNTQVKKDLIDVRYPPPVAAFSAKPTKGSYPLKVVFSDKSEGFITGREWKFGDGGTDTGPSPVHTYRKRGTYSVSLKVTGPGGTSTKTLSKYIQVTEK